MGYPFDRLPYAVASADAYGLSDVPRYVATLEEYVAGIGNIAIAEVGKMISIKNTIFH